MLNLFTELGLKFFFLFTPFFALSMFLAMTADKDECERRRLGRRGISILMRLTALILAALSAQMIMTGVCGFLKG